MFTQNTHDEELYVLMGKRIGRFWCGRPVGYQLGLPSEVRFDPDFVWNNADKIVGWIHTHPVSPASPSKTDHATMTAWITSLGKPLLCSIKGSDGLRAWWFFHDNKKPVEGSIFQIGHVLCGFIPKEN